MNREADIPLRQPGIPTLFRGFRARMVYLQYITCLRYTVLVRNPRILFVCLSLCLSVVSSIVYSLFDCFNFHQMQRVTHGQICLRRARNHYDRGVTDQMFPFNQSQYPKTGKKVLALTFFRARHLAAHPLEYRVLKQCNDSTREKRSSSSDLPLSTRTASYLSRPRGRWIDESLQIYR